MEKHYPQNEYSKKVIYIDKIKNIKGVYFVVAQKLFQKHACRQKWVIFFNIKTMIIIQNSYD